MKNLKAFFYLFIQHIRTAQRDWLGWECLHYARTSCFNCSDWRYERVFGSWSSICIVSSQLVLWNFRNYLFCGFCWGGIDSVWVCKGVI